MHRVLVTTAFLAAVLLAQPLAPASAQTFLDRAREAVKDAGKTVEDAAKEAGRSVRDFLTDNPDLNRDVVDFGTKVGVPGFEDAKPVAGAAVTIFPSEGIPGAQVLVKASGLPGNTDVTISAGPPRSRSEVVAKAKTSDRGTLDQVVSAPQWLDGIDAVVFIVETADERVRVVSERFTVRPAAGESADAIIVTGTLSKEGAECPALRGDDGKLYTLADPKAGGFGPGDRVRVAGMVAEISTCQQGTTIAVKEITAAK